MSSPVVAQFECNHPGCGRHFSRKEHLTRHLRTHDPQLSHQCPICGRRYARSDVLKRHLAHHPPSDTRRDFVACANCQARKVKCDGQTPCHQCRRWSIECTRPRVSVVADNPSSAATVSESIEVASLDMEDSDMPEWPSPSDQRWADVTVSPSPLAQPQSGDPNNSRTQIWPSFQAGGQAPSLMTTTSELTVRPSSLANDPIQSISSSTSTSPQSLQASTPASSLRADHVAPLDDRLAVGDAARIDHLLNIFFGMVHPLWPLLHVPTFDKSKVADVLMRTMLLLASRLDGGQEHVVLAPAFFETLAAATQPDRAPSLHILQAVLYYIVYAVSCWNTEGMVGRAVRLNLILVSACRCLEVFSGQQNLPERLEEDAFSGWMVREELRRLAFAALRIDAYLSVLLDQPPCIRYQELAVPLPKSSRLWAAATETQRRRLQWDEPGGREKAPFSTLMHATLGDSMLSENDSQTEPHLPYRLTAPDHHLFICALQHGTWEAAMEAHSAASDDLVTKLEPGSPIRVWRRHIRNWRRHMENDTQLSKRFLCTPRQPALNGDDDPSFDPLTPLTLLLFHISIVKMHSPLNILQLFGGAGRRFRGRVTTSVAIAAQNARPRLRRWMFGECPRTSLRSAAQIARVVTTQVARGSRALPLNALAVPGLLMSAVAACSFASQTRACGACTGRSGPVVDVVGASDGEEGETETEEARLLDHWINSGEGWATWGEGGPTICRCRLEELAGWFREALSKVEDTGNRGARQELEGFLEGLVQE